MAGDFLQLVVYVDVRLSFWQALKLRLAGATFIEGYVKRLLEENFPERTREGAGDD